MKNYWWIVAVVVVVAGYLIFNGQSSGDGIIDDDVSEYAELITLDTIVANQTVASPLVITGQAVGPWYFEASFPIELKDGNGLTIASDIATAQSDWMVTGFVPFTATLTFPTPVTTSGTLILHKDNPSGEPINDDQLIVPVSF